ncbi:hypothetical protein F2Q68_00037516 [Brassica cretica]|uniref:Uncharacterized protein n=1 Tax=Brassica cretica TaxID=69181 RepID=A0A8S9HA02_BRACR|nr:hypothetical protein F2Q68_00037516 [Brassica cretica]
MKHSIDTSGSVTATSSSSFFSSTATSFFTFTSAPSFSRAASRFFMGLLLAELGPRVAVDRDRRLGPSSNPLRGRGLESTFRRLCVGFGWLYRLLLSSRRSGDSSRHVAARERRSRRRRRMSVEFADSVLFVEDGSSS